MRPTMCLARVLVPSIALVLFAAAGARAEAPRVKDGLRWVAVFEESAGGAQIARPSSEVELVRVLLEAGLVFVDEAQSQKIRSVTDAGTLVAGSVPGTITSLDADMI